VAITLITGVPGSGKSALIVSLLAKQPADRPVYVHGIPDLKVKHLKLEDPHRWHLDLPDGALVVIDEVQEVWRAAGAGQKVPESIQALERHRHRGFDFIIATQGPKLVHSNVRALVNPHIHLRNLGFLGRRYYEWPECSDLLSWKSAPISKKYKLPKRVFSEYRSATIHNKPANRIPASALVLGVGVVALVGLGWYLSGRLLRGAGVEGEAVATAPAAASAPAGQGGALDRIINGAREVEAAAGIARWPEYASGALRTEVEPFEGLAVVLDGHWQRDGATFASFGLIDAGQRIATMTLAQVVRAGYSWKTLAPCVGALRFGEVERRVICGKPALPLPAPAAGASVEANASTVPARL